MKTIQIPKLYDHFAPVLGTKIVDYHQARGAPGLGDLAPLSNGPSINDPIGGAIIADSTVNSSIDWLKTAMILLAVAGTIYVVYKIVKEEEREEKERGLNV